MKHLVNYVLSLLLISNSLFASNVGEKQVFNVGRVIASSLAEIEAQDFREHIKTEFKKIETDGPIKYLKEYSDEEFRSFLEENPSLFQVPVSQKFKMKEVRPDYWEAKVDGFSLQASLVDLYQQQLMVNGKQLVLKDLKLKDAFERSNSFLNNLSQTKTTFLFNLIQKMLIDEARASAVTLAVVALVVVVVVAQQFWKNTDDEKKRYQKLQSQFDELIKKFDQHKNLCLQSKESSQKAIKDLLNNLTDVGSRGEKPQDNQDIFQTILAQLMRDPKFSKIYNTNDNRQICHDSLVHYSSGSELKIDVPKYQVSQPLFSDTRLSNIKKKIERACTEAFELSKCLNKTHGSFDGERSPKPSSVDKIAKPLNGSLAAPR